MIRVLSLGVGVQSSTLLLMSVKGVLPKLDAAVFADPGWESLKTYDYLEYLKPIAEAAGIKIVVGSYGNIRTDAITCQVGWDRTTRTIGSRWASMPLFVLNPDGSGGMVNRQCTSRYKIGVINRQVKAMMVEAGLAQRRKTKRGVWVVRVPRNSGILVEKWIGISYDEIHRRSKPESQWLTHRYPLIQDMSRRTLQLYPVGYTRDNCIEWLAENGYRIPPRSACIGCPFHSDAEWISIKTESPDEFEDACQFDEAIRNFGGMRGHMFLHSSRVPLREVLFKPGKGGMGLAHEECMGMCGN